MLHTVSISLNENNTHYLVWPSCKVHNARWICLNHGMERLTFRLSQAATAHTEQNDSSSLSTFQDDNIVTLTSDL